MAPSEPKAAEHSTDPTYLRRVQYRDSTQLAKRANLHVEYRTAPLAAFDWITTLFEFPNQARVLDVGAGNGYLWGHVADRSPGVAPTNSLDLTLTDLSPGMVAEATKRATETGFYASVTGEECDARDLPFADASFDIVVSTYALYHVPQPEIAVAEIARVVRPGGVVIIMTNGPGHLREIEEVRVDVFGEAGRYAANRTFAPKLAATILLEHFDDVRWHRYRDTLLVTDAKAIEAFVTSSAPGIDATDSQRAALRERILAATIDGVFTVSKDTGAFICHTPR